eukprot:3549758-Pyramimonas_sp.AAC.1
MSRSSSRGSPRYRARPPAIGRRPRRSDRGCVIRDKTLMAVHKAKNACTTPRRRARFDTDNVEYF